jgi:GT2 family glycosyltransferase
VGIALDGMSRQMNRGRNIKSAVLPLNQVLFSGCACLFRADALAQTGLFDEDFFAYCEDTDLGLRGRLAGWRCVFVRDAIVKHHYSAHKFTNLRKMEKKKRRERSAK